MSRVGDVAAALAESLRSIEDVQVFDRPMGNPTPPTIQLMPAATAYHRAMGLGLSELGWTIQVFVPFTEAWIPRLYEFIDPGGATSIVAAAERDQSLGGVASDVTVTGHSGVVLASIGMPSQDVLLVEFACTVEVEGV